MAVGLSMFEWLKSLLPIERICNLRHYRTVRKSGLFDSAWYSENYPAILSSLAPIAHYLLIGGSRGNDPNPTFNGRSYLDWNRDVSAAGADPFVHYIKYGRAEGRRYSRTAAIPCQAFRSVMVGFTIAGVQKGGTTALARYLAKNPEICMPNRKEVHFFDNENFFSKGNPDYSYYHTFFDPKPSHKMIGDVTPRYMYWYDAPRRMWHYNPAMKVIIILRNPIERAYAHWNMQRHKERDELSFMEAVENEQRRCREALPLQNPLFSYIDRGYYSEQLRRIWTYFPRSQTLILKNEDLREKPCETMEIVSRFLGVGCLEDVSHELIHCTPYSSPMSDDERAYLRHVYEYEIRILERMLGWDCSSWLD